MCKQRGARSTVVFKSFTSVASTLSGVEMIHTFADCSPKGISKVGSIVVSYRYDLVTVDVNHQAYAHQHKVIASRAVSALIKPTRRNLYETRTERV